MCYPDRLIIIFTISTRSNKLWSKTLGYNIEQAECQSVFNVQYAQLIEHILDKNQVNMKFVLN